MSHFEHQCTSCGYVTINNKVGPLYCPNCNTKMNLWLDEHRYNQDEEYDNDDNYHDDYSEYE